MIVNFNDLVEFIGEYYDTCDIAGLEIETIEDTKPLEPFKYDDNKLITSTGNNYTLRVIDKIIMAKINEIIKVINKEEKWLALL